ncbi:hypothetical protein [Marivirga sp.]|uniref:hypothetical protein n=1 Tax=Marivirga sp. TaxID=2018662 RepID=UPI0025D6E3CD|nr:hypothetical protein [Marivirga sp.]
MKFNKLFLFATFLLLISCNGAIVYEEIDLQVETEAWIVQEEGAHSFQMIDENGIKNTWNLREENNYYSESGSAFLLIPTRKTMREMHYQKFSSTILGDFSINADAGFSDGNAWVSFNMPNLSIDFDAVTYDPIRLYLSPNSGESFSWYVDDNDPPFQFQIVTDYEINGKTFTEEVAVFELTSRTEILEPNDIVKFSFSKDIGLIYLELKSGLKYFRI